ncbi:hypothetical protein [Streptomyces chartreusis]|uniref:Uncharacterized protein n=1 Tax=Streptomyces chartreusis TaxID=1969 RepID=A0A7H8TLJ4_STRCX|nr:hypothetical protein [Streptomyces chartreusis]QKZ23892.1 hypothetical protein HUT05_44990 [Streptomyces chartreusis]
MPHTADALGHQFIGDICPSRTDPPTVPKQKATAMSSHPVRAQRGILVRSLLLNDLLLPPVPDLSEHVDLAPTTWQGWVRRV